MFERETSDDNMQKTAKLLTQTEDLNRVQNVWASCIYKMFRNTKFLRAVLRVNKLGIIKRELSIH